MKKKLMIFGIVLTLLIVILSLGGCGKTEESTLTIDGKQVKVPYVMIIDGKKVSLDEYRYYFLNMKKKYDSGDETVWDKENALKMLKLDVLDGIKESYAVWDLAEKNGMKIVKEDEKKIADNIDSQIKTYGSKEKYQDALTESYMTEDLYDYLWRTAIIYDKLNHYYFDEGGEYYNPDVSTEMRDQENEIKMKELIQKEKDELNIEYGAQYDLITTKSLI